MTKSIKLTKDEADWIYVNVTRLNVTSTSVNLREVLDSIKKKITVDKSIKMSYPELRTIERLAGELMEHAEDIKKEYTRRIRGGNEDSKAYLTRLNQRVKMLTKLRKKISKCL